MTGTSYKLSLAAPLVQAEIIAEALEEISQAVALTDDGAVWSVEAYFSHPPDPDAIKAILNTAASPAPEFAIQPLAQQDWVKKSLEGLTPVKAGPFIIHGSHDRRNLPANAITIEIEAGLAFGTGHHATTSGCLTALDRHLKSTRPQNILDLGTGTGVLAIAAAKALKTSVLASDIDEIAIEVATANARLNNTASLVHAVTAPGFDHPALRKNAPYDLILANILARPLARLAHPVRKHLAIGGTVILSGLLEYQSHSVEAAYKNQGLFIKDRIIREGWVTLILQ